MKKISRRNHSAVKPFCFLYFFLSIIRMELTQGRTSLPSSDGEVMISSSPVSGFSTYRTLEPPPSRLRASVDPRYLKSRAISMKDAPFEISDCRPSISTRYSVLSLSYPIAVRDAKPAIDCADIQRKLTLFLSFR